MATNYFKGEQGVKFAGLHTLFLNDNREIGLKEFNELDDKAHFIDWLEDEDESYFIYKFLLIDAIKEKTDTYQSFLKLLIADKAGLKNALINGLIDYPKIGSYDDFYQPMAIYNFDGKTYAIGNDEQSYSLFVDCVKQGSFEVHSNFLEGFIYNLSSKDINFLRSSDTNTIEVNRILIGMISEPKFIELIESIYTDKNVTTALSPHHNQSLIGDDFTAYRIA